MEADLSFETWGPRPETCRYCACAIVLPNWGQCIECGRLDKMWNCGLHYTHGWPYAGHVCGPPLDRTPSWGDG